jgi:large subunit ribosomal protein L7/L12
LLCHARRSRKNARKYRLAIFLSGCVNKPLKCWLQRGSLTWRVSKEILWSADSFPARIRKPPASPPHPLMTPALVASSRRHLVLLLCARTLPLLFATASLLFSPAAILAQTSGAAAAASVEKNANFDVVLSDMGPNKISVIKEIRALLPGMGLADAKHLVESAPVSLTRGVTQAEADEIKQKLEAAGAAVLVKPAAAPSGFDVILSEVGPDKLAVVRAIRDADVGMGIAEGKVAAESAPTQIKRDVTMAEAETIKLKIEAAGAKVIIQPAAVPAGFDVILSEMGANKITVIKEIREVVPGMGLADAKNLVERAPTPIKRGVSKSEAESIKQKVEAAGAKVLIKQH